MLTVIGHINPDTDSTCSAIVGAHYLTTVLDAPATPYVAGPLNKEATYVLNHFSIPAPEQLNSLAGRSVALVDTNNPEELLPGWQEATITGIVDHHKLVGGLSTPEPITVLIRPVACTATLLHDLYVEASKDIPQDMASLMLAAIISDTVKFTSPTTTDHDRVVAEKLAAQTGISVDELAEGMFAAKSDLTGMSIETILTTDGKSFSLGGGTYFISVHETVNPTNALAMRAEFSQALQERKERDGLAGAFFFVVDILNGNSELIVPSDHEAAIADKAFGSHTTLPGIISRKKQMVPKLESVLNK